MKKSIIVLMLALAGCATMQENRNKFAAIIINCDTNSVNANYGNCVQSGLDEQVPQWKNDLDAPYINAYIQWLNAAGARVDKGEMSADDARSGAQQLMARLKEQARLSAYERKQSQDAGMAAFFAGLAVMSLAQPAYRYTPPPSTTTYTYPGMNPISCTNIGNIVSCI